MKKIVGLVLGLMVCGSLSGETLNVPTGAHPTVQSAIEAAVNGDIVLIQPGVYEEAIDFLGKAITVTGLNPEDPAIVASTLLWSVEFSSSETESSVLEGLTISNGTSPKGDGLGIYCFDSSPTIQNNLITGNGKAISCSAHPNPIIRKGCSPLIQGNIISQNSKGAIDCSLFASPRIINNTLVDNSSSSSRGAGLTISYGASAVVSNCIFWNKTVPEIVGGGGAKVSYSCVRGGRYGTRNFSWNPELTVDYRLKSRAGHWDPLANSGAGNWIIDEVQSPSIDAGDPNVDFSQEPSPNGQRINIGAFGNTAQASKSFRVPTQIKRVYFDRGNFEFEWWARKDEVYRIYYSSDLVNWKVLRNKDPFTVNEDQPWYGWDPVDEWPHPKRRFYRLKVEPR